MNSCCKKKVVTTEKAKAIGPYSVGIQAGHFVFCSGQMGVDPATGELAAGVEAQTKYALESLSNILTAAGSSLARVVKTTVFLQDMNDFARMNAVYAGYFPSEPPARSTIQVAALPRAAAVEIECMALLGDTDDADCLCSE